MLDDIIDAVRSSLAVLLPAPPPQPFSPDPPTHTCVDLLLRLLGSSGATEKRINTLPVVVLRRRPRSTPSASACTSHGLLFGECGAVVAAVPPPPPPLPPLYDPTEIFDQDVCSICLETYEDESAVRVLGCCHVFHATCVQTWLRRRPTCPMCNVQAC